MALDPLHLRHYNKALSAQAAALHFTLTLIQQFPTLNEELLHRRETIRQGGGPKAIEKQHKTYGGAYIVMSSKYIRTDLVYAWPTAEIAVMGAEGAVNILYRKRLAEEENANNKHSSEEVREQFVAEFREQFGSPYAAAASGHVDDVILPSETRTKLIAALDFLRDKQTTPLPIGVWTTATERTECGSLKSNKNGEKWLQAASGACFWPL